MKNPLLDRNLGFLLGDVSRLMRREFDRRIKDLGLNRSQWFILAQLYRQDGVTQTELADQIEMDKAPVGRALDRLEESDWITRKPDSQDRRVNRIFVTEKINSYVKDMRGEANRLYKDACRGLSKEDVERFIDVLVVVKTNLDTERRQTKRDTVRADTRKDLQSVGSK